MEPYQAPLESSRLGETIINGARIFTDTDYRFQSSRLGETIINGARIFTDTDSNTCKVLKITF